MFASIRVGRYGRRTGIATLALAVCMLITPPASAAPINRADLPSIATYLDKPGGQWVIVPGGTYSGAVTKVRRGAPLVLVAFEPVIIHGTVKFAGASSVSLYGQFIIHGGVHIRSSERITLDGVEITNRNVGTISPTAIGVLINVDFNDSRPSRDIVVTNSFIHDTYDDAFRIGSSQNVLLHGNRTERIFDMPRNTCDNVKCHDDGLHVTGAIGLRVINNDFAANLMSKSDFGPIEIVEFSGNRVRDDHHYGINVVQTSAVHTVRLNVTGPNWSWNHAHGPTRFEGDPTVIGRELIVGGPPPVPLGHTAISWPLVLCGVDVLTCA